MQRAHKPDDFRTYGKSRAVRLPDHDYAADVPTHITLCAKGEVFRDDAFARIVCASVERCSQNLGFRLFAYCLMPDHLHVLLSPGKSGTPIETWLLRFKSFTTNVYMKLGHTPPVWQRSGRDHVCRATETAETVARYVANNPIRAGFVTKWDDWPYTRVFVDR